MENIVFWLLAGAYLLHIVEEYLLDWKQWTYNISKLEMSWKEFFFFNSLVLLLGISSGIIGYSHPYYSFIFVGLTLVNAITAHIGATIATRKYSPGLITSIFLFIPLTIFAYIDAMNKDVFSVKLLLVSVACGFLLMLVPVILQIVKRRM